MGGSPGNEPSLGTGFWGRDLPKSTELTAATGALVAALVPMPSRSRWKEGIFRSGGKNGGVARGRGPGGGSGELHGAAARRCGAARLGGVAWPASRQRENGGGAECGVGGESRRSAGYVGQLWRGFSENRHRGKYLEPEGVSNLQC